jgi:hypothetical protein
VAYCVPQTLATDREHTVYLRVRKPLGACTIRLGTPSGEYVYEKKLRYVFPAEMLNLTLRPRFLENFHSDALRVEVVTREIAAHEREV